MSKENRTWREEQQEHKRALAECAEQTVVLRRQSEASLQHIAQLEAHIQAQKQQYNYRLFHWLLNHQLKRLDKQRQQVARIIDQLNHLEQTQRELEEVVEQPPPVRFRRRRVVYLPAETFFFLLLMGLVGWLVSQWLLHG